MIFFFLGILVVFGFIAMLFDWGKDASKSHKDKKELQQLREENAYINENIQTLWDKRVRELGLDFSNAIYVLAYSDDSFSYGTYRYMWYEDGAIANFFAPKKIGDAKFYQSPAEWKVFYFEKNNIEGFFKRNDHCKIVFKDNSMCAFDVNDYDKIKKLIVDNNIIPME